MNKKSVFIYALIFVLMFSLTSFASNYSENVIRYYNNIKIKLNGQELIPKDENGNIIEPFVINGTTYLPVRAIGNALGLDVNWDSASNTVILNSNINAQHLTTNKVIEPTESQNYDTSEILIETIDIVSKNTNFPISSTKYLDVGETFKLATVYFPTNATDIDLTWKSSNPKIAMINSNGKITALSEGTTYISVTTNNNVSDSFKLKVKENEIDENINVLQTPSSNSLKSDEQTLEELRKKYNITDSTITSNTENANIERYKSYVTGLIYEKMSSRGLLDSSMTTQMINKALEDVNSNIIVYVTDYGEKYHVSSCQYLYNSSVAIRKGKAIKTGYLPCSRCNP